MDSSSGPDRDQKRRRCRSGFVFGPSVWLALMMSGCQTPGPRFDPRPSTVSSLAALTNWQAVATANPLDPQWLAAPTNAFTLGPGDRLEIEVLGDSSSRAETVVGPDGKIYFYLLAGLDVWGLTLSETKLRLERELGPYLRDAPRVALTLRRAESKRVWILGRFQAPGVYPLAGPTTLLEAIASAGGPAAVPILASAGGGLPVAAAAGEPADLRRSFLIRQGRLLPVDFDRLLREGDMAQNIYLQPDDFIYLPSVAAREAYVLGAVAQPRAVPVNHSTSLVAILAHAGGAIPDAHLSQVAIVRGTLAEPQIAVVDLKAIMRGKQSDVLLEPRDIVYVPFSPYRTLTRYVDLILTTFARTVGVNEGARAVQRGAVPVGINVPIN